VGVSPRAAVGLTFFLNGALYGAWAARVPAVQDRLGIGDGELGLALAGIAVGSLAAMPAAGAWSVRAGSRRPTRLALLGACVTTPLLALAPSFGTLIVATILHGAVMGALDVAMNAHGVTVERGMGRPVLSGFHAAFSIGGLVGAATGAVAAGAEVDPRVHLLAAGALAAAVGLPATRTLLPGHTDSTEEGPRFARPTGVLWALGAAAFCCLLAEGAAADWSAIYVDDDLGADPGLAGLAFAAFSLTMTAGRVLGDRLTARFGAVALLRAGGLLGGAGLGAALAVAHPAAALVGFACLGAGLSTVIPSVFRAAGTVPGVPAGPGLAAVTTVGYAGFLAGPPLVGAIAEVSSLPVGLAVVSALAATIAVLAGAARPAPVEQLAG
jgi:MFS family permease